MNTINLTKGITQLFKRYYIYLVIVCMITSGMFLIFHINQNLAINKGDDYLKPYVVNDSLMLNQVQNMNLGSPVKETLVTQMKLVQNRQDHYKQVFTNYYSYYYATISVFRMLSVITGIFAFLIAKTGWDNITNWYLKITFLTLAAGTSFYGLFPTIYKQDQVIKQNLNAYLTHTNLQLEIYNYSTTRLHHGDTLSSVKFIDYIDGQLIKHNKLHVEFNHDEIKKDFLDDLNSSLEE